MRFPNGYGSIIDLGPGRRRRFAVRICTGYKRNDTTKRATPCYKYLQYFEKRADANIFLANYNVGNTVKEHTKLEQYSVSTAKEQTALLSKQVTWGDVFDSWFEYRCNQTKNKAISEKTKRNYERVRKWSIDIVNKKFTSVRTADLQAVADQYREKSSSTTDTIKTVWKQIYRYAIKHEITDIDYSSFVDFEWTNTTEQAHIPFTDNEIDILWNNKDTFGVDYILMMIYSGMRISEFIGIENKNVHLNQRYLVGGMKTAAGRDRIIPINNKVLPFFEKYYSADSRYLIQNSKNTKYSYGVFYISVWSDIIARLNMNHSPHDTRHTFATLMDKANADPIATKLIMGHSISDITKRVYTHKSIEQLIAEIDKI